MKDLSVEEFVCTSVMRRPILGIDNGRNCLLGRNINESMISLICLQPPPEGSDRTVGAIRAAE